MIGWHLQFAARRRGEAYLRVSGGDGRIVAVILPATFRARFVAKDRRGDPLCSGRARTPFTWLATDPHGARLVTVHWWPLRPRVTFRAGAVTGVLRKPAFGRDWTVMGDDGAVLVHARSLPDRGWWDFLGRAPDAWQVDTDGTLTLAELVGVVELYRRRRFRNRRDAYLASALPV